MWGQLRGVEGGKRQSGCNISEKNKQKTKSTTDVKNEERENNNNINNYNHNSSPKYFDTNAYLMHIPNSIITALLCVKY